MGLKSCTFSGRSSTKISSKRVSATARSMQFDSSRTLPGQPYASSFSAAALEMPRTGLCEAGREALHEVLREQQDVAAARTQRRQLDVDHVQPVEQILAKQVLVHRGLEIAVGGGDDARVERHLGFAAHRTHPPLLQCAQQLGLQRHRQLADLVHEQRARVGLHEQARARVARVRERALDVTEQLALQQRIRHRRAVHRDEAPGCARAALVKRVRDQLFASAALAR